MRAPIRLSAPICLDLINGAGEGDDGEMLHMVHDDSYRFDAFNLIAGAAIVNGPNRERSIKIRSRFRDMGIKFGGLGL